MKDRAVLLGSLVTGALASACCIGPLVLGVLGLGSLGLASGMAAFRPWFLALTAILLSVGFYFAYRPRAAEACATGPACAKPASRRSQRIALWAVTVAALAVASYPSWGARVVGSAPRADRPVRASTSVSLAIEGMTCPACAAEVEQELVKVPGVARAEVSYQNRSAAVQLARSGASPRALVSAVERAGYRARLVGR